MSDNDLSRRPERPRQEPEIIPPGRNAGAEGGLSGVWIRVDERDGMRRVYLKRPGPFSIVLALIAAGTGAALVLALLAGLLLFWIPLVAGGILLALLSLSLRSYWHRFRLWWAKRR